MARGFFTGLVRGGLLAGVGLASLSLLYPMGPVIGTTPPIAETFAPIGATASGEEAGVAIEAMSEATTGATTPSVVGAPVDTQIPAETDPLGQIEVGGVAEGLATLTDAETGGTLELPSVGAAPDATSPINGLDTPASETTPQAGAQPSMPDVLVQAGAGGDAPEGGQAVTASPSMDAPPTGTVPDPAGAALAEAQPGAQIPPVAQPEVPQQPTEPESGSRIPGQPVGQIGDLAEGVTTNRLPSIGSTAQSGAEATPAEPALTTATVTGDLTGALARNAQSFENPEGRPIMAVLLKDIGADRTQLGDLKNLPFPMTFVVDASADDAAQAIAYYRSSGAEVVLSVPLPEGATPSDIEVTLSAYAPLLADAVAMLAPRDSNFQTLGASATQVGIVLEASGHGLISIPQGLNTGHKSVRKEGVSVGLIFRELDNDGQSGSVIRRFMDNAAFKARQNQGVIMLGHARVETIQALIEWSLGNRAESVALAPVSALLSEN